LESERAGEPGKLVATTYVLAAREIEKGTPTAIVIDDFDTTVGEWENNTGTVNHQQVVAQIMHLADSPTYLEKVGTIRRVPIFLTGNDFSKLYTPLKRPGRMLSFYWTPNNDEVETIAARILDFLPKDVLHSLITEFSGVPISFFTEIRVRLLREACSQILERLGDNMQSIVSNPLRIRNYTLASFNTEAIEPSRVFAVARQIVKVAETSDVAHLRIYNP